MRAWTVDADDIRAAEDLDESLLHRTPEIDSFLTPDRDDKFNNIRLVKERSHVRADPLEVFLGRTRVTHTYTREEEGAFEYICRHTLLRPRDW
jgi:hypothetical protein